MTAIPQEKLDRVVERWLAIQDELNHGVSQTVFAKLNNAISTDEMRKLNYKVDGNKKSPKEVAAEWVRIH